MTDVPESPSIVLIGPRAAGKTSVGRALAAGLGWEFVDTDLEIAVREGVSAGELLAARGEPEFRVIEARVVADCLAVPGPRVIALGGGSVEIESVRRSLRELDVLVVHLDAAPDELVARSARDMAVERPPLTELPLAAEVAALRAARAAHYVELRDLLVDTTAASVSACVAVIVRQL